MNNALDLNGFDIWHLGDWLGKMFASLLMTVVQWGCLFVFLMESVFWALARGVTVTEKGTTNTKYVNLIDLFLFENGQINTQNTFTKILIYFILIGIGLTILMAVISIIKSHISTKDEDHNPTTTILGVVKAVVLMIAVPFIVYAILKVTNAVIDGVCSYANISNTVSGSFANKIFFMFSPGDMSKYRNADGSYQFSFMLSEDAFTNDMGKQTTWEQLFSIGFRTNENFGLTGYNYIFAIIVLIILCIALFKAMLLLGDRIIDLITLYLVAPLPIACYPNDDGKRYDVWKELIISKIVSALGYVIAFIVYLTLVEEVYKEFSKYEGFLNLSFNLTNGSLDQGTILTIVYLMVIIAGGLSVPAVYAMLAQLVGQTAGRVAESDLNNANQDIGHVQRGMMMVGGAVGGAALGIAGKALLGSGASGGALKKAAVGGAVGATGGAGGVLAGTGASATSSLLAGATAGAGGVGQNVKQLKNVGGFGGAIAKVGRGAKAVGSYFAARGLLGGAVGALGLLGKASTSWIPKKWNTAKEGKYNDLVNQAVNNYDNKDKLGEINNKIGKMGGRQVDDTFMAERINTQNVAKKQAKLVQGNKNSINRLDTHGAEGKRLAKELNPQIKEQKGRAEFAATRQDAKEKLKELKSEKKTLKGRKD